MIYHRLLFEYNRSNLYLVNKFFLYIQIIKTKNINHFHTHFFVIQEHMSSRSMRLKRRRFDGCLFRDLDQPITIIGNHLQSGLTISAFVLHIQIILDNWANLQINPSDLWWNIAENFGRELRSGSDRFNGCWTDQIL